MQRAQVATVGQATPDKMKSETPTRYSKTVSRPVRHSLTYANRRGITLVEMLIAVAITLVIMAAVVTAFATISDSVQQRRATGEMSNSLRHARNVLQRDLAGVTCNMLPWQKPEWNHGYFELIEGPYCDFIPSALLDSKMPDANGELDYELSAVPSSNLLQQAIANGLPAQSVTDGRALGDYDDILMFTSRNEREPFVGRVPDNTTSDFVNWTSKSLKSPLAEVVWFSIENPADGQDPANYFGEPGFRTVYRRTLLIAPWLDPYRRVDNDDGRVLQSYPGVVRILPRRIGFTQLNTALACLVAFQERYDLSVHLEWDPLLQYGGGSQGRWKLVANSLSDLTKRENRYEHHGLLLQPSNSIRAYPFAVASMGAGYTSDPDLRFMVDPEIGGAATAAQGEAVKHPNFNRIDRLVLRQLGERYRIRPFVYVDDSNATAPATVRALVATGDTPADQQVVYLTAGLVPLGGERRGEDVMLTDALAFDLRVYDPGAPLLGITNAPDVVVEPGDAGWSDFLMLPPNDTAVFGYGAYVDLGFLSLHSVWKNRNTVLPMPNLVVFPHFATSPRIRSELNLWGRDQPFFEPYRVYDTWSFHYENNGLDEDNRDGDNVPTTGADEGTNGFDDLAEYVVDPTVNPPTYITDTRYGVDDAGERETSPPYDVPLRGIQVRLRAYERDSRQVREVSVKQHFVPE